MVSMNSKKEKRHRFRLRFIPLGVVILILCLITIEPVPESRANGDVQSVPDSAPCVGPSFRLTPKQLSISLWAAKVVASKTKGNVPRQDSRDLNTLYGEAAAADKYLKRMTRHVATLTGGTAVFPPGGGLKGRTRAEEKIEVELGGDASRLMDISRSSIEYDSIDKVYQALQFILDHDYEVVRMKDRALTPLPSGFWDIHLNLRMPNGHIVELQLHYDKIRRYSIDEGHRHYERVREIESRAFRENRPLTPNERSVIEHLNCEQRRFYQKMFEQGQKRLE
jgi:hypothetical protein